MDPFDDIFAQAASTHARAGGKFQPKAKNRPKKQTFVSAPSVVLSDTKERSSGVSSPSLNAEQSVLPTTSANDRSDLPNSLGVSSLGVNVVEESLKNHEDSVSGVPVDITMSEKSSYVVGGPKVDSSSIDVFHHEGRVETTSGVLEGADGNSCSRAPASEVDLVGLEVGHFIDSGTEPASNSARVSCEQKISASFRSTLPDAIEEKLVTVPRNGLDIEVSDNTRSLEGPSQSHATDGLQSEVSVPDAGADWHSGFGKSFGENVDLFSGLEYLDDYITETTSGIGTEASKSQCKGDTDVQHGDKFLSSYCVNNDVGGSVAPPEMVTRSEENLIAPARGSFESSAFTICDVTHTTDDPVTFSEISIPDKHEEVQVTYEISETKESESLFDFETCEATVVSGKRSGKFQPRPKLGKGKEKSSTSNPQSEVRSAIPSEALHFVPLDNGYVHEGSISGLPQGDVLDYSTRFSDSIVMAPTPEIQGETQPTDLTEATQSDYTVLGDVHFDEDSGVPGEGGKSRKEEACNEPNYHQKNNKSFTTSKGVEGGKPLMQLRKRSKRLVDEIVDEGYDVNCSTCEVPSSSNRDEDEDDDEEYRVDSSTSRKKKALRKVKEPLPGNEKPGRRRKNTEEASNDTTKDPSKKFSHSTRRTKRRVDKALLDTPEDEIDPQRLPIKDLILLAEHRERLTLKEAAKLKTPQTNQSAENSFREDSSYNEEEFGSEQGQYSDVDQDQASYKVQPSSSYVNYQSFMEKTPSTRWSKQDTELFYEAVRQFGTDFAMIQQLFPGRTRHQVKLKFKKEERQHPLRLSEAITNRAKDHSHFESVIEQLQQAAAQAKHEPDVNESVTATGEGEVEEPADGTNDGVTKSEWDNGTAKDQEADVAEVHNSPSKFDESDDDEDRWGQYNY